MGLVNWAVEFLYKVVPKADLLVKMTQKGITVHGYHGGGLDGVNSNLFLKHLNHLEDESDPRVAPIFQMLRNFCVVKRSCFGINLSSIYGDDIDMFNSSVHNLIKFANEELKIKLFPTWKIHILVLHLKPFLDLKKVGLGIYCEQTTEAAHAIMKPTIQ